MKLHDILYEGEGYRFASTRYKRPGKSTRGNMWSGHAGIATGQQQKLTPQQKALQKAQKEQQRMLEKRAKKDYRFKDMEQWKGEVTRRFAGRVKGMTDSRGNMYVVDQQNISSLFAKWNKGDKIGLVWAKPRHINPHDLKEFK